MVNVGHNIYVHQKPLLQEETVEIGCMIMNISGWLLKSKWLFIN